MVGLLKTRGTPYLYSLLALKFVHQKITLRQSLKKFIKNKQTFKSLSNIAKLGLLKKLAPFEDQDKARFKTLPGLGLLKLF